MQRCARVLMVMLLTACANRTSEIYAGPLQALSGTCDTPLRAELSLRGGSVLFTPASGTLVLRGQRTADVVAAQEVFITPDHKPYTVIFTGQLKLAEVDGLYTTPRCRYRVHLRLTQD